MTKNKKTILITGAKGQVGQALVKILRDDFVVIATDRHNLDITNAKQVALMLKKHEPDVVIHAAAVVDVDACETDKKTAKLVNVTGTKNVVDCSKLTPARWPRRGLLGGVSGVPKIIYISTDFVFSGKKRRPYRENDVTNPISYYGQTKLEAEKLVLGSSKNNLVVRPSLIYGGKKSFLNRLLDLAKAHEEIRIVDSFTCTPTYVVDLASAIKTLIEADANGIYHASGSGTPATRFEIGKLAIKLAGFKTKVLPAKPSDFPTPAKRPAYSYLSTKKLASIYQMPDWKISLKNYFQSHSSY